ncbi:MAG: recombination regulator RecX, partial [Oscillospiraceae bacterium]|nr:recombination regulator RecX [Oscillospiraceae bacterium]
EELLNRSRSSRAREKAYYLLSMRDHSQKELEQKLRDGQNKEQAESAARRMAELGLINDRAYAERLARELMTYKHYSENRIRQMLQHKGIDRETADEVLEALAPDDLKQALALLEKRRYNDWDNLETRDKAAAMLVRQGFRYETVRSAIRQIDGDGSD